MAGTISLSRRDIDVLGKIRDPEASPENALLLDSALPRDPHVTDEAEYARVSQRERDLILAMQQAETALAGPERAGSRTETSPPSPPSDPVGAYRTAVAGLGTLIDEHPRYASARNNRAQALRWLYGDDMLLEPTEAGGLGGRAAAGEQERAQAAATALSDLDCAVALLMPAAPSATTMSPTAARTLSLALTQRAAVYHATAKQMAAGRRTCSSTQGADDRREARWSRVEFEEAASRDFALGARFGNEIARGLAVSANPTAKLCGQMVQQMLKSEYGVGR